GQTKQQVTNTNKSPILCDRCSRVGAVTGCKACEEALNTAQPNKRSDQLSLARSAKKPKSGAALFDLHKFSADFGALLRQVDALGNAFGVKDTPEAEALRLELDQWKDKFKALYRKVSKQEPPKV